MSFPYLFHGLKFMSVSREGQLPVKVRARSSIVTIAGGDHNTPQPAHYRETFDAFLDALP